MKPLLVVLSWLVATAAPALAQDAQDPAPALDADPIYRERYPLTYQFRPLTLLRTMVRGEADLALVHLGYAGADTTALGLSLGAAFGITDDLEVGATLVPLQLADEVAYGDIPVYARFRFLPGPLELGAQVGVVIPTRSDFGLDFGLVALLHGDIFRVDIGALFAMAFGEDGGGDAELKKSLRVPLSFSYNFDERVRAEVRTGLQLGTARTGLGGPAFFDDLGTLVVPLGVAGYYTFMRRDEPFIDVGVSFDWPLYLVTEGSAFQLDTVAAGLSMRFFHGF